MGFGVGVRGGVRASAASLLHLHHAWARPGKV